MEKEYIPLNQLGQLIKILYMEDYKEHLLIYDLSDEKSVRERLEKMTLKQYNYFLALFFNKRWFLIKDLLDKFLTHK